MIRSFEAADMEAVLAIWLEASTKAHGFVGETFWESKVSDMRDIYLPASETFVYEDKDGVLGFVSLCEDTLAAIFVSPGFQGKGIGRQLMAKAKEKRQSLTLTVYKENVSSVAFYERCGFKTIEEQEDVHTGHTERVMAFDSETPCQG